MLENGKFDTIFDTGTALTMNEGAADKILGIDAPEPTLVKLGAVFAEFFASGSIPAVAPATNKARIASDTFILIL